jgi:broad specificity phosphatase PhoE
LKAVDLDAIYSTDYIRTKSTAQPISTQRGLEILKYNPKELNDFAKLLIGNKKDVLVVGHSNTTGVLAGLLAGEEIGSFNEDIYNRIYQVVIYKDAARLHILHSSFYCNY